MKNYILCKECDYYVIDGIKSYCENDHWKNIVVERSILFNPPMFECIEYEHLINESQHSL